MQPKTATVKDCYHTLRVCLPRVRAELHQSSGQARLAGWIRIDAAAAYRCSGSIQTCGRRSEALGKQGLGLGCARLPASGCRSRWCALLSLALALVGFRVV